MLISDCSRERAPLDAANFNKSDLKKTTTQGSIMLDQEKSIMVIIKYVFNRFFIQTVSRMFYTKLFYKCFFIQNLCSKF